MNKMLRAIKLVLIVLILIFAAGTVYAGGDMVIQLRLYEGFNEKGAPSGVIVSSYYLQKLPGDNIIPFVEVDKEKKALMDIYKLKEVKQVAGLDVVLKEGKEGIRQDLPLNGRTLTLQLDTVPGKKDRFKVEVLETPQGEKPLMETEIIMPEKKTAVMGFKDSAEKIFFLAFIFFLNASTKLPSSFFSRLISGPGSSKHPMSVLRTVESQSISGKLSEELSLTFTICLNMP